ncbi:DNA polymerase III subunit chi [Sphingomonas solaris]|uniref:DNA polymerase III subunit chi n=1 Tax=Alterirhizorhabdus solaris TaxID=2529389 RepID=A0A558R0J5_9SPHN|nr:DNA polymerase III subunit chi [Sphingomonas solaris]TVV72868.1 DNA polymerase III subunit chi [Sphingomonas solaris]
MQVDFYHLAATAPERVIAAIAGRILGDGGRLLVVARDDQQAQALDEGLWTAVPDSFLPHGRAGQAGEANQPILIATTADSANGARNIALADGEWREAALGFDRVFHFFDDTTIAAARAAWKALAARDGIERRFWKQDAAGRWTRAA